MTPPRKPARTTEARKNVLYTMFSIDMAKLLAPERVTVDMIHSEQWRTMRKAYYELFEPVLLEQEKGTGE